MKDEDINRLFEIQSDLNELEQLWKAQTSPRIKEAINRLRIPLIKEYNLLKQLERIAR